MEFKEEREVKGMKKEMGINRNIMEFKVGQPMHPTLLYPRINRNIMEFKAACSPVKILFNFELIET